LWISSEYVRAILFTGFPWAILGYTQYRTPIIIQIADVTGSYGVSFLIMMVNFVLYSYLYLFLKRTLSRHILISQTLILIIIMTFVLFYGYSELRNDDSNTGLKLSVIQGNIEQGKKWDTAYKDYILTRYEILTKEAAKDRPDLIIWPETSIPGLLDEEDIGKRIRKLAKDIDIPLFLGAITYESHFDRDLFFNSAVLFSLDGYIEEKYDKLHLVPFGEYVPFERYLPFIRDFINVEIGDYTKGREFTLFDIKSKRDEHFKYAALICFEDIFPALVRRFISNGANFLINITNDAWFKESSEQLQHAQASVFRAVENRVSVIRAANTGFSCYINPNGIIENSIYDKNTKGMYVPGYKTFELKISERSSFYTRYGDVFSYICIAFVLSALLTVSLGWRPT